MPRRPFQSLQWPLSSHQIEVLNTMLEHLFRAAKMNATLDEAIVNIAGHGEQHENGGTDEISVSGLSGLLADGQTPLAHATSHSSGGSDPVSVLNLGGYPGGTTSYLRADASFAVPAGGGAVSGYYAPLTDGDTFETQLIFADGDVVMAFVPA